MKLLFDLFPVILFFAAFKVSEGRPQQAADLANEIARLPSTKNLTRQTASLKVLSSNTEKGCSALLLLATMLPGSLAYSSMVQPLARNSISGQPSASLS